jgi:AraC-like DNA-binding protein
MQSTVYDFYSYKIYQLWIFYINIRKKVQLLLTKHIQSLILFLEAYMDNNLCFFVPKQNLNETVHTVNFVLERKVMTKREPIMPFMYAVHCVLKGEGIYHLENNSFPVKKGDVFFVIPSHPYYIESVKDFEYGYATYLGLRANEFAEQFKISTKNCVFYGLEHLADFWINAFKFGDKFVNILSESVILYTFAHIGYNYFSNKEIAQTQSTEPLIKKYIDEHFAESDLSLKKIGEAFSYSPKYISTVFKKEYRIGVSEYVNVVRIQHACTLVERGLTAVNDISYLCGYNDPLYFSKVFKSRMGTTPKDYIKLKSPQ